MTTRFLVWSLTKGEGIPRMGLRGALDLEGPKIMTSVLSLLSWEVTSHPNMERETCAFRLVHTAGKC